MGFCFLIPIHVTYLLWRRKGWAASPTGRSWAGDHCRNSLPRGLEFSRKFLGKDEVFQCRRGGRAAPCDLGDPCPPCWPQPAADEAPSSLDRGMLFVLAQKALSSSVYVGARPGSLLHLLCTQVTPVCLEGTGFVLGLKVFMVAPERGKWHVCVWSEGGWMLHISTGKKA